MQDILLQMKNPKNRGVENLQQQVLLNDLELDYCERVDSPETVQIFKTSFGSRPISGDGPLPSMLLNARKNPISKNRVLIVEDNSFQALAL